VSGIEKGEKREQSERMKRGKERGRKKKRGFGARELLNLLQTFVTLFLLCLSI